MSEYGLIICLVACVCLSSLLFLADGVVLKGWVGVAETIGKTKPGPGPAAS